MPIMCRYECSGCKFNIQALDRHMYVMDDRGNKIICKHPGEQFALSLVLGIKRWEAFLWLTGKLEMLSYPTLELLDARVGIDYTCLCMDCLHLFGLDVGREARRCPECSGQQIKRLFELGECSCPTCKTGTIKNCGIMVIP